MTNSPKLKPSIYVTKPDLPAIEDLLPLLEGIWSSKILTNGGPLHTELERRLSDYLNVRYVSLFANATIALLTALQTLRITGEVITTPYSFVATAHSLVWNGLRPVFVDIDQSTFNLDPSKIEDAITPQTTAIMPVHCYGVPCDVDAIQKIADRYYLKVIYDAAHAFGVKCHCGSVLNHGDLSVLSFHATKVFNTFEGGAIVCSTSEMKERIDQLKNFGYLDEVTVIAAGINGKMSELNAAVGLAQLPHVENAIAKRKAVAQRYRMELEGIPGILCPTAAPQISSNHAYFPILVQESYPLKRDELYEHLKRDNIFARRYFYPLVPDFPIYKSFASSNLADLSVAKRIAGSVLCLPIYPSLAIEDQDRIIERIRTPIESGSGC
jgi:dTDP-4-amino-4,6-dideoxygalactose transaminase